MKDKENELVLSADKSVTRKENVIYRPSGPWTPHVHSLLRHLQESGFTSLPSVIGSGLDEDGREMLSFIEGEFIHPGPWSDEALVEVGGMLRKLHDASAKFVPAADAEWKPWFLRGMGGTHVVYSHGDVAPWNMVTRNGHPFALIDWEFAGPVDPLAELARVCWLFPQLHDDDVADRVGLPSLAVRARQLRLLVDAYGLDRAQRHKMFDLILEVVVRETAEEAIENQVTPDSQGPLWGIAWRARAAAWILRHRSVLQNSLA
ncbi:aminoglycoside phosphotransferase family protein [Paenibacillus thermotolerans]|uniref:aminoglycoside phosphotransferase family protein n=1 Tax=Paenibacillus thermotolerans TaxID=3027807 RepID=UPI002368067B|nr:MULTISPECIES: aminoglycoside phosphotransferase family protein [unclassified Paenibacillus]